MTDDEAASVCMAKLTDEATSVCLAHRRHVVLELESPPAQRSPEMRGVREEVEQIHHDGYNCCHSRVADTCTTRTFSGLYEGMRGRGESAVRRTGGPGGPAALACAAHDKLRHWRGLPLGFAPPIRVGVAVTAICELLNRIHGLRDDARTETVIHHMHRRTDRQGCSLQSSERPARERNRRHRERHRETERDTQRTNA